MQRDYSRSSLFTPMKLFHFAACTRHDSVRLTRSLLQHTCAYTVPQQYTLDNAARLLTVKPFHTYETFPFRSVHTPRFRPTDTKSATTHTCIHSAAAVYPGQCSATTHGQAFSHL